MKIVIVGDGKVGFALTQQLAREDHDIVVIDSNKMVLKESQQMVDIQVVHGNGASPVVQSAASVGESDLMIAATSADEINLLCCIVAKKLGCSHTIARVCHRLLRRPGQIDPQPASEPEKDQKCYDHRRQPDRGLPGDGFAR